MKRRIKKKTLTNITQKYISLGMPKTPLLSALVMAHNEEQRIADCLKHLQFCDEIIVVLDKCTDKTELIAKKYNAKTFKGSWEIEGKRRNFGRDKCNGKWILEIDADEHIPPKLAKEIIREIKKYDDGFFSTKVTNFIGNKKVKYGWSGTWGKTETGCLSGKYSKHWSETDRLHPPVTLKNYRGQLETPLLHYAAKDITQLINRFNSYTSLRAQDLLDDPSKMPTLWRDSRRIVSRFLDSYIRLKGYREGGIGFINAVLAALYHITAHLKATAKYDADKSSRK